MKRQVMPKSPSAKFPGGLAAACSALMLGLTASGQGTITFNRAAGLSSTYYVEVGMWFQVVTPPRTSGVDVMGVTLGADNTPRNGTAFMDWFRQHNPYDYVELHLTNGSTFGLTSVQLADPVNPSLSPVSISFIGYPAVGSTVTNTFTTPGPGPSTFATYTFNAEFSSGLSRVDILAPRWAMDNLAFTVPEPSATVLVAMGLLGLAVRRRGHHAECAKPTPARRVRCPAFGPPRWQVWTGISNAIPTGMSLSADLGGVFWPSASGTSDIDNWANPATNAFEFSGTNWLGTNVAYDLRLEYAHFTNDAQTKLLWMTPGMTNEEVIPQGSCGPFQRLSTGVLLSTGATGVTVDSSGKIWAGCFDSDTAVRIDPNAGPLVLVTNVAAGITSVVTNHVGLVDMMVDLGDSTAYQAPYNDEAHPYNYSDMTGFNMRVVNPSLKPLKGYWITVNDSGNAGQLWNRVSWTAALTNGCSIEVYVRVADDRPALSSELFVPVTNNGWMIEFFYQ